MTPITQEREHTEYFRASVGAMLINACGSILVLKRADVTSEAWQMPQGGLRKGEDLQAALRREFREETGILPEHFRILEACKDWLVYELPDAYRNEKVGRGQAQKWFLCQFLGEPDSIKPDGIEFVSYEWVERDELLHRAAPFRRSIYERLVTEFSSHFRAEV